MLNSNTSSTCPDNMVNFGLLTAEICWRVWSTPANFSGFRVFRELRPTNGSDRFRSLGHPYKFQRVLRLGSITARHLVVGISQTLACQNFVSSINSRTSIKRVWNMINKIPGKRSPTEIKHLQVGDKEITAVADIADTLAESFSEISSNKH